MWHDAVVCVVVAASLENAYIGGKMGRYGPILRVFGQDVHIWAHGGKFELRIRFQLSPIESAIFSTSWSNEGMILYQM